MGYAWFVAQALAGLEATAIYNLSRAGITAYSPTIADRQARYFPGYVFVELEGVFEAGIVNRTRGVHKMLPIHASEPLPLPPGFVEELRERVAAKSFDDVAERSLLRRFAEGDEVVTSSGLAGRFVKYHKDSGEILAALLGRENRIRIPLDRLSPVGNPSSRGARRVGELIAA